MTSSSGIALRIELWVSDVLYVRQIKYRDMMEIGWHLPLREAIFAVSIESSLDHQWVQLQVNAQNCNYLWTSFEHSYRFRVKAKVWVMLIMLGQCRRLRSTWGAPWKKSFRSSSKTASHEFRCRVLGAWYCCGHWWVLHIVVSIHCYCHGATGQIEWPKFEYNAASEKQEQSFVFHLSWFRDAWFAISTPQLLIVGSNALFHKIVHDTLPTESKGRIQCPLTSWSKCELINSHIHIIGRPSQKVC